MRALALGDPAERNRNRFWLVLQEPGRVPERKGPWVNPGMRTVLREFMEARPTAYIHVLTVNEFGEPMIAHGPEMLQMLDARSMITGRKHNERVRAAHAGRHDALAAGTGTAETNEDLAQSEGCQSGPKGNAQAPDNTAQPKGNN